MCANSEIIFCRHISDFKIVYAYYVLENEIAQYIIT